ncbi:MAG: Crp/Fnr family transcriptional regulator [Cytophagales bacterium]|nr:Crp/Fnr family transcriptional regulator [Cytophagales bacterium]
MKNNVKPFKEMLRAAFPALEDSIDHMASFFEPMHLKKNEYLVRIGKKCRYIVFINSGVMRNYLFDNEGNEIVKYMTCNGDFNTVYRHFIKQESSLEHVQAVTDCDLMAIDYPRFDQLKNESEAFRSMTEHLLAEGLACKEERLVSYLTQDAQKRYENLLREQPLIIQYSPMQFVASYLGMSRETLSRIRNRRMAKA